MKLVVKGPHALDLATLRQRVDARIDQYDRSYPHLKIRDYYRWVDDTHATGGYKGGSGKVALEAREVVVELDLPFFARIFKAKIEDFVRKEIDAVVRGA